MGRGSFSRGSLSDYKAQASMLDVASVRAVGRFGVKWQQRRIQLEQGELRVLKLSESERRPLLTLDLRACRDVRDQSVVSGLTPEEVQVVDAKGQVTAFRCESKARRERWFRSLAAAAASPAQAAAEPEAVGGGEQPATASADAVAAAAGATTAASAGAAAQPASPAAAVAATAGLGQLGEMRERIHEEASTAQSIHDIYEFQGLLGEGTTGGVYEARNKRTGERVAIKVISKAPLAFLSGQGRARSSRRKRNLNREISILSQIAALSGKMASHPHLVSLKSCNESEDNVYIVMEFVEGGQLFDCIADGGPYNERDAGKLMRTLCETLQFLHANGIVHRDLKPENILLRGVDKTDIVITDFGLSAVLDPGGSPSNALRTRCGTPYYMAPEMHEGDGYGSKVDVWSAGVILYVLLTGILPFFAETSRELVEQVRNADETVEYCCEQDMVGVSADARRLVKSILVADPKQRPTVEELLAHPWMPVA